MVLNQNIRETAPVTDVALISSTDLSPGRSSTLTSLLQTHEIAFKCNDRVQNHNLNWFSRAQKSTDSNK